LQSGQTYLKTSSPSLLLGSVETVGTPTKRKHAKQLVFSPSFDKRIFESSTLFSASSGLDDFAVDGPEETASVGCVLLSGGSSSNGATGNK
jgi:hypothetical protein